MCGVVCEAIKFHAAIFWRLIFIVYRPLGRRIFDCERESNEHLRVASKEWMAALRSRRSHLMCRSFWWSAPHKRTLCPAAAMRATCADIYACATVISVCASEDSGRNYFPRRLGRSILRKTRPSEFVSRTSKHTRRDRGTFARPAPFILSTH
jgi:hypothetical protein